MEGGVIAFIVFMFILVAGSIAALIYVVVTNEKKIADNAKKATAAKVAKASKPSCCDTPTRKDFSNCEPCTPAKCTISPTKSPALRNGTNSIVGCLSNNGVLQKNKCYDPRAYGLVNNDSEGTYAKRCEYSCGINYTYNGKPLCPSS